MGETNSPSVAHVGYDISPLCSNSRCSNEHKVFMYDRFQWYSINTYQVQYFYQINDIFGRKCHWFQEKLTTIIYISWKMNIINFVHTLPNPFTLNVFELSLSFYLL
jgi:hypothetical protein